MRAFVIIAILTVLLTNEAQSQNLPHEDHLFGSTKKHYARKNPALAGALSVGVTLGSFLVGQALIKHNHNLAGGLVIGGGLWIGPSAGNIYVGNGKGVWKGIGTRLLGGLSTSTGMFILIAHNLCFESCKEQGSTDLTDVVGGTFLFGGMGLILYSTIYDWVNSVVYAQHMNRQHKIEIAPGMNAYTGKPTLNLRIRF